MGCSQSVETEEDRRLKNLKYLDDLKKEEESKRRATPRRWPSA